MPQYKNQAKSFDNTPTEQRRLLRSLMNVRSPEPLDDDFLKIQDEFLSDEVQSKGKVTLSDLSSSKVHKQIYLWQGDITTLEVDAIVNAGNSALLGCFIPCHGCIDNAIHSVSGLQLRRECNDIMENQQHSERTGTAKITKAYNLPCNHVIHTVGPIISGNLRQVDCDLLSDCYKSCLELAISNNLKSIAFCCISTGEFCFPNDKASEIAVNTVLKMIKNTEIEVIFNVFKDIDYKLYSKLL